MAEPKSAVYDHQAGKVLELSGGHALDLSLLRQIKPHKSLASQVTASDKTLARYLVKKEATSAHTFGNPVLRVLTKPPLPDSSIVAATIARYVKHCRHNESGHVLEALLGQLAAAVSPVELRKVVDELLFKAVKRNSSSCVSLLATRASHEALNIALREALLCQRAHCVKRLLSYGADPNFLGFSNLLTVMIDNVKIFKLLLRAQIPLLGEHFGPLCTAAVHNCGVGTLNLLMRARYQTGKQKATRWNRDGLVRDLLKARKFDMFYVLAASTVDWPLTTGTIFTDAIESTQGLPATRKKVIEILLCLTRDFNAVMSTHLPQLFSSSILENDCETMSLLLEYSHFVPPKTIGLICRLGALDMLDAVLYDKHVHQMDAGTDSSRISFDVSHLLDLSRAVLDESRQLCPNVIHQLLCRVEFFLAPRSTGPVPTPGLYEVLSSAMKQKMQNGLEARIVSVLEVIQDAKLQYKQMLALGQTQLGNLLLSAAQHGLALIAEALHKLGVSPNTSDIKGRSALLLAVLGGHEKVVKVLVDGQALVNDGSLHAAACEEQWEIMRILLIAGHSPLRRCTMFGRATVLEAYVRHAYSPWPLLLDKVDNVSSSRRFPSQDYPTTISILVHEEHSDSSTARKAMDIVSVLAFALTKQHTYALVNELLSQIEKYTMQGILSTQYIYRKGSLRFSILGLVERWPKVVLDPDHRQCLIERMRSKGYQPILYTTEGEQPSYAVGVPEALVEAQKRLAAFRSKECSIQVYCTQAGREEDIHARLTPACAATHCWDDMIICTGCLQSHLEARMFPLDDPEVRFKFPSVTVPCWAPGCQSILSHDAIRSYVKPEIFTLYDNALLQQHLRTEKSMAKCATPDCPGAIWFDVKDDRAFTVFLCLDCYQNTCIECNDLYEKHNNQLCPAGEARRKNVRLQREDELSKAALDQEKKCPRPDCGLAYEHLSGCDHIVCGKNTHDSLFDLGCRHEFCARCYGEWPRGHRADCIYI